MRCPEQIHPRVDTCWQRLVNHIFGAKYQGTTFATRMVQPCFVSDEQGCVACFYYDILIRIRYTDG